MYLKSITDNYPNVFPNGCVYEIHRSEHAIIKFGKDHRYVVIGNDNEIYPVSTILVGERLFDFELLKNKPTKDMVLINTDY